MPESGFAWTELKTGIAMRGTSNRTDQLECVRGVVSSLCYVAPHRLGKFIQRASSMHQQDRIKSGFRYGLARFTLLVNPGVPSALVPDA